MLTAERPETNVQSASNFSGKIDITKELDCGIYNPGKNRGGGNMVAAKD